MTPTGSGRILRERSILLVVDMQGRLAPAIEGIGEVSRRVEALLRGAVALGVPTVFTEQYPAGLGPTAPALLAAAPGARVLEKIHFDATAEPGFAQALRATGRHQVVLAGTEAHVCVLQTALGLLEHGFAVALAVDAVGSRRAQDRETAVARLAAAGACTVTTEMVLFEWLARADTEAFRRLLPLIRTLGTPAAAPARAGAAAG